MKTRVEQYVREVLALSSWSEKAGRKLQYVRCLLLGRLELVYGRILWLQVWHTGFSILLQTRYMYNESRYRNKRGRRIIIIMLILPYIPQCLPHTIYSTFESTV